MAITLYHWISFTTFILFILGIDLLRFRYNPHAVKFKEAIITSGCWIALAISFNLWIYFAFGFQPAINFLTCYLLEESLSIDNLFIFLLLFSHFKVPETAKHQVLFYGVLGAIVMRGLMIWGGITLIQHFEWLLIAFGIFLLFAALRLLFNTEKKEIQEENALYSWLKRKLPFTETYHENRFFVKNGTTWQATPLLALLILIEITDLIFALDSVPASLGITLEPFIVYTSNIFAILGLRSLFFALEGVIKTIYFLHYALAFILFFIGCKMITGHFISIPTSVTLIVLASAISLSIIASYLYKTKSIIKK